MRRLCDLHTHSTASDGKLLPAELIELADSCRLAAVALTDHDTTEGLREAAAAAERFDELAFIPGIELSAASGEGGLHLLGYHIDPAAAALRRVADHLRSARDRRNPEIVARLQTMGLDVTMDDVLAAAAAVAPDRQIIGRPHIAAVLVAKGYAKTVSEAFDRYIGSKAPAYVQRDRPSAAVAIGAIHSAGGVAVLAHPVHLGLTNYAQYERVARSLIAKGLDGLEAYHSDHTDRQTRFFLDLARRFDLLATGGSDFHGPSHGGARLGRPRVPATVVGPLRAKAEARRTTKLTKNTKATKNG